PSSSGAKKASSMVPQQAPNSCQSGISSTSLYRIARKSSFSLRAGKGSLIIGRGAYAPLPVKSSTLGTDSRKSCIDIRTLPKVGVDDRGGHIHVHDGEYGKRHKLAQRAKGPTRLYSSVDKASTSAHEDGKSLLQAIAPCHLL